jgi:predicted nucleotidyltransferase
MRILVFGNINAGKSTVVEVLRDLHPDLPVISIDDYRKRFGDGSFDGDHKAMSVFTADASATKSCIVECTGLGPLGRQLQKALEPKSSIILHVRASPATCIERIIQKDFSSTPYPPFSEALPDTITRCHSEFEAGDLETLWKSSAFWIFSVDGESTATERMVADLPFVQLSALSVVCSALTEMNQSNALIWYGSGPRGELGPESDIDLFLWTDQASVDIESFLQSHVQEIAFTDILGNKLIIRFYSGVLVEVTCSDDLSALDHFYSYSRINDRSSSILIGNESVLNHINRIAVAETNSLEDVRYLLDRGILLLLLSWPISPQRCSVQVLFSCQYPLTQYCAT